jgi:hypothetical protein
MSREAASDFNFQLSKFQLYSKTPAVTHGRVFLWPTGFPSAFAPLREILFLSRHPPQADAKIAKVDCVSSHKRSLRDVNHERTLSVG